MPIGLHNPGNNFQCLMDQVLGDLFFCLVYVEDILFFCRDLFSHIRNLLEVFLFCQKHGLIIWLPKCEFTMPKCEFNVPKCEFTVPKCEFTVPKCEFTVSKIEFFRHLLSTTGCSALAKHSALSTPFLYCLASQLSGGFWEWSTFTGSFS